MFISNVSILSALEGRAVPHVLRAAGLLREQEMDFKTFESS